MKIASNLILNSDGGVNQRELVWGGGELVRGGALFEILRAGIIDIYIYIYIYINIFYVTKCIFVYIFKVNYFLSSLVLTYACAFIFTVVVELPFANLEFLLLKK